MGRVRFRAVFALAVLALGALLAGVPAGAAPAAQIVTVPIHGTIDEGMAHLVGRAIHDADVRHAKAVVLDVDTFGGLVAPAIEIRDDIVNSPVRVYAYVSGRAWSAGALITLAAGTIGMAPSASIGAAEPIPKTVKTVSALRGEFSATATIRHRDPVLAAAMVDAAVNVPGAKPPGAILTLTADQAQHVHFSDVTGSRAAALAAWKLSGATVVPAQYTLAEQIVRFATDPSVSGILLAIGFLGLLIEMQTLSLIGGIIGFGAFALFFGTHVYAGFSNELVIALAVLGVVGIVLELHVLPGHGVSGVLGAIAMVAAVVLAFGIPFIFAAVEAIAIAIVLSIVAFALIKRFFPRNAFMQRITFTGVQGRDYVASEDHRHLIGASGIASSYLRPAGVAFIGGRRVDVLTEGDFVPAGAAVVVTRVEGARIFVRREALG